MLWNLSLTKTTIAALAAVVLLTANVQAAPKATPTNTTLATPTGPAPVVPATPTTVFILPTNGLSPQPTTPLTPSNQTGMSCPGPLIPNTQGLKIKTCMGKCCIKCPAFESFYEPDEVQHVLRMTYYTRQVSLGFAAFMAISYLVLPGKKAQPHISVLFLTVSLALWYAAFDVMPGISNACANDFEQSTGHNSRLCGVQGVLIVYLTQTSALWCSLLIYKLHLLAVWRADFIDRHYKWCTLFCWAFPLAFAIPVAVKNLAEYPGIGFSCIVSTSNLNTYLFYPTAVYMYPAMVCHVVTIGKMIHLAVISSKIDTGLSQLSTDARMRITTTMQAKRLLRGQWRPALMMFTVMTSLTVFWLFYFVDAHRLADMKPDSPWLQEWVACLFASQAKGLNALDTQRVCSVGARASLPSIPWFTVAEMLVAIIGIVVALVFISKSEFWEEWAYLLTNLLSRGKTGSGSSRGRRSPDGSSSPTLNGHDHSMRKGGSSTMTTNGAAMAPVASTGGGRHTRNDQKSMSSKNLTTAADGSQWYDMDDLLDKDYEDHSGRTKGRVGHRHLSDGSQAGMTYYSGPNPVSEPPRHNNLNEHRGDLLYRPPASHEAVPSHWTPSAHTLSTPSRAYMGASDNDRYVEHQVVPSPVPRTANMGPQQPPVFLSNSTHSSSRSPPTSPTSRSFGSGSLSPMPPRSPTQNNFGPSRQALDSVPIIGVATRGSPAQATFAQPLQVSSMPASPTSPTSQRTMRNGHSAYNSNESTEQIMVASRTSIGGAVGAVGANQQHPNIRVNTALERAKSPPPPSLPSKSRARQNQSGYMSPPIQSPSSPSSPYR
ncbi:hypothetical protein BGZ94_008442 [Podila epigama]|nr:hypothetical protein BGZ94_008442 [Podila epigama]